MEKYHISVGLINTGAMIPLVECVNKDKHEFHFSLIWYRYKYMSWTLDLSSKRSLGISMMLPITWLFIFIQVNNPNGLHFQHSPP